MTVLGCLPKLKGDLGLAFGEFFQYNFSKKLFFLILYHGAKF